MRTWKLIYYFLYILLILNMLFFHVLKIIEVDYITISLLVLLIALLLIPNLKKLKWKDFEAVIGSEEVINIEKEIKELPDIEEGTDYLETKDIAEDIYSIFKTDHISALAKLRIELEKILIKILITTNEIDKKSKLNHLGIGKIVKTLENKDLLDRSYVGPIKEVINICNRAIHGEEIKINNAYLVIQIGLELLERLYSKYSELIVTPIEESVITKKELDKYVQTKYEIITITPYVKNPKRKKYILTQDDLDEFLDNYGIYAEFLVSINKLK